MSKNNELIIKIHHISKSTSSQLLHNSEGGLIKLTLATKRPYLQQ